MLRFFVLLLSLLPSFAFAATPSSIIFGDSLSDEGRIYQITNQEFPPSPFFEGRFSNGPVWSEYLEGSRVNFAVAGAKSDYKNALNTRLGSLVDNTGLQGQIDEYLALGPLREQLASATVYINIGGNDFLGLAVEDGAAIERIIPVTVDNIIQGAKRLRKAGATEIILFGLPNLAHIPLANNFTLHQKQLLAIVSIKFNRQLKREAQRSGFEYFDTDDKVKDIMHDASEYGIKNIGDACLDEVNATVCSNPEEYFFWDTIHPSAKVHQLFAEDLK